FVPLGMLENVGSEDEIAAERSTGGSVYAAYNDGAVKAFAEWAVCADSLTGDSVKVRRGNAIQGEISFSSRRISCSVKGKDISGDYGSPFFSTFGLRTPAQGIFFSMKVSPFRAVSLKTEGSAERRTAAAYSGSEPYAAFRESAALIYAPVRFFECELSHRQTGRSVCDFPERRQGSVKGEFHTRFLSVQGGYMRQSSDGKKGHSFSAGIIIKPSPRHRLSAEGDFVETTEENPVYSSAAAMGDIAVCSASSRQQIYVAKYRYCGRYISLRSSASMQCSGKDVLEKRWELCGEGSW
ncbi:MAG: hypothetical protein ACRCUT_04450, partial [Spirochaetota bacterium]